MPMRVSARLCRLLYADDPNGIICEAEYDRIALCDAVREDFFAQEGCQKGGQFLYRHVHAPPIIV